jgi:glycosyltransferase involved in cell wall biosynthesis
MGIVPIVDCEDIGDFTSLGMQYVRLQGLIEGHLPNETTRNHMANENYRIYKRLQEINFTGSLALQQVVEFETPSLKYHLKKMKVHVMNWAKLAFPISTFRGRVVRWVFRRSHSAFGISHQVTRNQTLPINIVEGSNDKPELHPCDILVQVDNFLAGGLENAVLDISEALKEAGYSVNLLVLGEAGLAVERARKAGFSVIVTQFETKAYVRLLKAISPKLVFSHYSLQGADICNKLNIPLIQMIHNIYMWFSAEQITEFRETIKYTLAFIVPSEFTKTYSVARLGIPEEKCCLMPYGIDIQRIRNIDFAKERSRLRMKYQLSDKDFVFLSVAAINHQKNPLGLARAFHAILEECPRAKLILLGPNYEKKLFKEFEKYISQYRLKKQIVYAGWSAEAYSYYAMADAFVCASFFEGGPLVLQEALAANLPIVTTEVGIGSTYLFKNHKGIAVVPPPIDIFNYHGAIEQLHSTVEFERDFASKLITVYSEGVKPNFSECFIEKMDKYRVYGLYAHLIKELIETGKLLSDVYLESWMNCSADD